MRRLLKTHFGFDSFLPFQEDIITSVLRKRDVFAVLPTGGGKSLCYQLPAMEFSGTTLVISPLISLMKDQVGSLENNNIPAAYLNSSLGKKEEREIMERALNGKLKLLYVAPERLMKDGFIDFLSNCGVTLIAVDEAHCISEWGHDFRPEYRKIGTIRNYFPNVPLIALTATATSRVRQDIVKQLQFTDYDRYFGSFDRKNLNYIIRPKQNAYYFIQNYIEDHSGLSGIVYCHSRKTTEHVAENLQSDGISAVPYHAGLAQKVRVENQEKFDSGKVQVIVATIAFGMGIDKPDVRFVIHYDIPKNLEGYYQETGRAGRDGLPSDCIMFFSYGDKIKHEFFINKMKNQNQAAIAQYQLEKMIDFCSSGECRRKMLLGYFGEEYKRENCHACDSCLSFDLY